MAVCATQSLKSDLAQRRKEMAAKKAKKTTKRLKKVKKLEKTQTLALRQG
jgi:hypothetical protein